MTKRVTPAAIRRRGRREGLPENVTVRAALSQELTHRDEHKGLLRIQTALDKDLKAFVQLLKERSSMHNGEK